MEYDYYLGEWQERFGMKRDSLTVAELRVLLDDLSEHGDWPIVVHIPGVNGRDTNAYPVDVEVRNETLVLGVRLPSGDEPLRSQKATVAPQIGAHEGHEPGRADA